jgi:2-polyprenyl-6-methoxyphenol hydroxylase-like FAD-dependent oxidoreductase
VRKHVFDGKDELNTVPLTQVVGNVVLDRDQLENQFKIATSAYVVREHNYRFFVGVRHVSDDASHAELYWLWAQLNADAAHGALWPLSASKQEQYDFVMSCARDLDPKFKEILLLSKPEDIHTPALVLRDMVVDDMPSSRVTLLGDAIHPMTPCEYPHATQRSKLQSIDISQTVVREATKL